MKHRKASRLTAAFVVTVASGCASSPPHDFGPVTTSVERMPDGTCEEMTHGNPPSYRKIECPPDTAGKPVETATGPTENPPDQAPPDGQPDADPKKSPDLEPAPAGWKIEPNSDGSCTAYGPDPCNHPGCNPPPPRKVQCPPSLQPHPSKPLSKP